MDTHHLRKQRFFPKGILFMNVVYVLCLEAEETFGFITKEHRLVVGLPILYT
jgi:hypothetical protein